MDKMIHLLFSLCCAVLCCACYQSADSEEVSHDKERNTRQVEACSSYMLIYIHLSSYTSLVFLSLPSLRNIPSYLRWRHALLPHSVAC
jgi:hypothetical protein